MADLQGFRGRLTPLLDNERSRPFVCKGSPHECRSFIVGLNAATQLPEPFFHYWSDSDGFNYDAFDRDYLRTRKKAGNRPRIERISRGLDRCLETNLYAKPTKKAAILGANDRRSPIIEFLFMEVRPELVFVHSNEPIQFFKEATGVTAGPEPITARWQEHNFLLVH